MIYLISFCDFPWCILPWLLSGFLGFLMGWYLRKSWKDEYDELDAKYRALLKTNGGLEGQLKDCNHDKAVLEGDLATAQGMVKEIQMKLDDAQSSADASASIGGNVASAVSGFAAGAASSSSEKSEKKSAKADASPFARLKPNNLQIIEGIGPKMESVLHEAGIDSWSELSTKSTQELRAILDSHGDKYKIINPASWSEQANLAAGGKWEDLILLQKQLDTGKDTNVKLTDSKLEKLMSKHLKAGFGKFKENDLKIVEGIGPKIAELLNNAGVTTWAGLADTSVERIQEILDAAGSKFKLAQPRTWPQQAGLAASGKWNELKELQDQLDGGK